MRRPSVIRLNEAARRPISSREAIWIFVSRLPPSTASAPRTTDLMDRITRIAPMAATPSPRIEDSTNTTIVASRARASASSASFEMTCKVANMPARMASSRSPSCWRKPSMVTRRWRASGSARALIAARQAAVSFSYASVSGRSPVSASVSRWRSPATVADDVLSRLISSSRSASAISRWNSACALRKPCTCSAIAPSATAGSCASRSERRSSMACSRERIWLRARAP